MKKNRLLLTLCAIVALQAGFAWAGGDNPYVRFMDFENQKKNEKQTNEYGKYMKFDSGGEDGSYERFLCPELTPPESTELDPNANKDKANKSLLPVKNVACVLIAGCLAGFGFVWWKFVGRSR